MHAVSQTRTRLIRRTLARAFLAGARLACAFCLVPLCLGGLCLGGLCRSAGAAAPEDVTPLPGLIRVPLHLVIAEPDGASATLHGLVVRPDGAGPFPLVVLTHGMPRAPSAVPSMRPELYISPAIAFARRGYAVAVVMRRGYGTSTGPFAEGLGPCDNRDYVKAGEAAGSDLLAALDQLRGLPRVDAKRILLVGHSMGGFAALAAASHSPAGVLGTISFAGGVGSPWSDYVCQPDRLMAADRAFGKQTHTPSLWLFARNDAFFGPDLARRMSDAYTSGGPPTWLVIAPDISHDGHNLIFAPPDRTWWPYVAAFLSTQGLPTAATIPLPPPASLPEPVPLDTAGRKAFSVYTSSWTYEKAFATDADGHYGVAYGHPNINEAEAAALNDCQRFNRVCRVYAAGNALAQH